MKENAGLRSLLWAAVRVVATIAVMIMLIVVITPPPVNAETPAERCKRETTAYNNAWKAIGKKPPAPYRCGSSNPAPPAPLPTTSQAVPDKTETQTKPVPEGNDGDGPNINIPTERRELEHTDKGQPTIGAGTPSTRTTGQVPVPSSSSSANSSRSPVPPNELLSALLGPKKVACTTYDEKDCQWYGNDPVNVLVACSHFQFKDEDLIVKVGSRF